MVRVRRTSLRSFGILASDVRTCKVGDDLAISHSRAKKLLFQKKVDERVRLHAARKHSESHNVMETVLLEIYAITPQLDSFKPFMGSSKV